jgi:hypothetical protein
VIDCQFRNRSVVQTLRVSMQRKRSDATRLTGRQISVIEAKSTPMIEVK